MLGRLKFVIDELVEEMLSYIPEEMFSREDTTFLDPSMGGGQFVVAIENKLRSYGHSDTNIKSRVFGFESNWMRINFAVNKNNLVGTYAKGGLGDMPEKKFDVIVGNPPFQDTNTEGTQHKIYNTFSKRSIELLDSDGYLAFITPSAVTKQSKRFTLVGMEGLKVLNFNADDYFDVGVKICYWILHNGYSGDVSVIDKSGIRTESVDEMIFDYSNIDIEFGSLYKKLKSITKKPDQRMFTMNPVDSNNGKSSTQDEIFQYPIYKIEKSNPALVAYYKPKPKNFNQRKIAISITKSLDENSIYVGEEDFTAFHVEKRVENNEQVENIKSFIMTDYFRSHSEKWKKVDGYGFNNCLVHLPPFDVDRKWDETSVKEWFESWV